MGVSGLGRDGAHEFGEDHGGGAAVAEGLESEEEDEGEENGFGEEDPLVGVGEGEKRELGLVVEKGVVFGGGG